MPKLELHVAQIGSPFSATWFVTGEGDLRIENVGPFAAKDVRTRVLPWLLRHFCVGARA